MANPKSRRILLQGLSPEQIFDRLGQYQALNAGSEGPFTLQINAPMGEWVQVDVPVDMPLWHFHNLAMWFEGDDTAEAAEQLMAMSHGEEERFDYWLMPNPNRESPEVLSGATRAGRTFQVVVPTGRLVDRGAWQRAPMPLRLAMMSANVHAYLHDPSAKLKSAGEVELSLGAAIDVPWQMPEAGNIADDFERTPDEEDPNNAGGLFNRIAGLFRGD